MLNVTTSPCCQIRMLAGSCAQPRHLYKTRPDPINGLIVPTLDADGWIWPIFVGSEKCDCKVMLCASSCLLHIGSVMWSDKLLKHLSNPTFQAGFCFHSIAVDLAGSQQPCSRLKLFACLTERSSLIMQTTCTVLQETTHNGGPFWSDSGFLKCSSL